MAELQKDPRMTNPSVSQTDRAVGLPLSPAALKQLETIGAGREKRIKEILEQNPSPAVQARFSSIKAAGQ